MKRTFRAILCTLIGVTLLSVWAHPQSVEFEAGFSSSVVSSMYAPIRIQLSDFDDSVEGILRVTQRIGELDAEPSVVVVDLYRGPLSNGNITGTIPIFDPLNPIEVAAMTETGEVLAESSLNLRLFQRTARFPLISGPPLSLGGLEVIVSPSELPTDWWAYEPVDSLWINGGGVSSAAWEAIARWVFAGGSLVVFAGDDYYQIDSPAFRELFPLPEARLAADADGTQYLIGGPSETVRVEITTGGEGELPLLYQAEYGSGSVSVSAVRASDLSGEELEAIRGAIPWSGWYSLLRFGSEYRGSMRVPRPIYMIAPSIVIVLLACVGVLKWARRRKELVPGSMAPTFAIPAVVAIVVGVSVWSGFYANNTKQLVELFRIDMSLQTHTTYGISLGYNGFVSPATAREATIDREQVSVPTYTLVKTTANTSFASWTDPESFRFTIHANEVRDFRTYGSPRRLITLQLDPAKTTATVSNTLYAVLQTAFLVVDGRVYRLRSIDPGQSVHVLEDSFPWHGFNTRSEHGDLFEAIIKEYRLDSGTWLLAISDQTSSVPGMQLPEEVRDFRIHIVEEGDA